MGLFSAMFGGGGGNVVDGTKARALVGAGATLLDVRSPGEFASGHLPGAVNIPVDQLGGRTGEVEKTRPVVVYCRSGGRSRSAANTLVAAGFQQVHDLGPMSAW